MQTIKVGEFIIPIRKIEVSLPKQIEEDVLGVRVKWAKEKKNQNS